MTNTSTSYNWWRKYSVYLCFASREEILEWQHPHCTTGNCRNHHYRDDFRLWANVTLELRLPFLGAVGASVWGVGLAGCHFSMVVSILLYSSSSSRQAKCTPAHGLW